MDNDLLEKKFDDIDGKIDVLIERCKSFQAENKKLNSRLQELENELEKTSLKEIGYLEQKDTIQSKIDGLLDKLNQFADS